MVFLNCFLCMSVALGVKLHPSMMPTACLDFDRLWQDKKSTASFCKVLVY